MPWVFMRVHRRYSLSGRIERRSGSAFRAEKTGHGSDSTDVGGVDTSLLVAADPDSERRDLDGITVGRECS